MTAAALLAETRAAGVTLRLAGSTPKLAGSPSPELLARLRAARVEVAELLRGDRCRHCGDRLAWLGPAGIVFADGTAECTQCEAREAERLMAAGASPRGMMSLMRAARVSAWLDGRLHVEPDDVVRVFPATMGHRLFFSRLYEMRRSQVADALVAQILQRVPTPR